MVPAQFARIKRASMNRPLGAQRRSSIAGRVDLLRAAGFF
jgi:hypothetical protein